MTILKHDPFVNDNLQIDPAVESRGQLAHSEIHPPLFLAHTRSNLQTLRTGLGMAIFTVGLTLKFIGDKK